MRVVLLGSGSSVPQPTRFSSGTFVTGDDYGVLVDPSAGSTQRLVAAGYSPTDVTAVLLTHYHPDHVADLVPFLFALQNPRYERRTWPSLVGPRDMVPFFEALRAPFAPWIPAPPEIDVRTETGAFTHRGLSVDSVAVPHTPVSQAYRLTDEDGSSVVISGDTEFSLELAEFARGCGLLLLECTSPDHEIPGHLEPTGARRIVERARPRETVLVHLNPEWGSAPKRAPLGGGIATPVSLGIDGHVYRPA